MRNPIFRTTLLAAALGCMSFAVMAAPQQQATPPSSAKQGAAQAQQRPTIFDELGLTDSQRASVKQLMEQNMQQARAQMQTLRPKEMAFENATPGTSAYQSAANDLAQAESTAAHDQVLRQADLRTKIYNVLTPEQRTKLATLRTQRQQQMQQRMQQQNSGASGAQSH